MKGIDGTSEGWIEAEYTGQGWKIEFIESIEELEDEALVDIPIGLPERSTRRCDEKARNFLSPERHHSIFNCPTREAVYARSYEEACSINEEKTGKRISKQAWNICPKIREVDKALGKDKRLEEAHPEVFFKSLDPETVERSKREAEGRKDRKELLKTYGRIPDTEEIPGEVGEDDVIDAMVLALGKKLELEPIPEAVPEDGKGREMKIMKPR